ncbi:MAG: tRNA (adenosine(37)-N6)-threonylcarbamoyltransferase complex dimerization subunit type 1 TsaB [Chitinophagia bacterium]|jgi:tRNA threonylcarbamoyladenosine biosynthesis protein TsaB|nr:tRNA (adenosine(37)-N6)-threonylcarbamoyltransferase complex dimerization subunit type 1 TsaB [Chitinophagia bacterium]
MVYILHLETSTKVCSVALSLNGQVIQTVESNEGAYVHGEKLTLFIQEVCEKAQIEMKDLNAISVASGPGSYTGLRIGVSTAKGLCYALGIPLIAIDSLTCIYEIVKANYSNSNILTVIDARRMEVFSKLFSENGAVKEEIAATVIEETTFEQYDPLVVVGDGAEKLKEIWKNRKVDIVEGFCTSAIGQASIAYRKFLASEFEDVAYYEPFYLKDFIAGVSTKNILNQ